jgi:anti-sigma-K factor RskA
MKCNGFGEDTYALYAIGALEAPEASRVLEHLSQDCSTCRAAIGENLNFWSTYAASATAPGDSPPAGLRDRVLASVGGPARTRRVFTLRPYWKQALAACILLGVWSAVIWRQAAREIRPVVVQTQPAPMIVPDDGLKQQLADAQRTVEELRASVNSLTGRLGEAERSTAHLSAQNQEQDRALVALRSESAAAASAALAQAQAKLEQARQDVEAQTRAAAAERSRSVEDRARLLERLRDVTARNQDLERQVQEVKAVLAREEQRLGPLLQLASVVGTPGVKPVLLRGTALDPKASGTAFVVEGSKVVVYFSNLPPLPANRAYQLWLMRRHSPGIVSGGVFTPDAASRALVRFEHGEFTSGVTALAVTDEPAGGSPGPTGHKYLIGT